MRMRRSIAMTSAFLALALLLLALAPRAQSAHAARSAARNVTTVRVTAAGVSLQYPRDWIVFALGENRIAAQQQDLSKRDPRLAEAFRVEAQTASLPNTKFQASDLSSAFGSRVSSGVKIEVVQGGFPASLENFTSVREPSVKQAGGTVLNAATLKVSGETSYRLDVSFPVPRSDGTVVMTLLGQLLIRRGCGRVVITVATSDSHAGLTPIDQVLRSVEHF